MNLSLLKEIPLKVNPSHAVVLGLKTSIFLELLHDFLQHSKHEIDGIKWVDKTIDEWLTYLPFLTKRTFSRIICSLKKEKLIIVNNLSKNRLDRVNWYAINYSALENKINNYTE